MKILTRILLAILATVTLAGPTTLAQSVGGSATITDLMGERPGNSYYQNTSSGAQTQGSTSSTSSAGANVLQQPSTGRLRVDAPVATLVTTTTEQKSSSGKLLAILAGAFFVVAVVLFVLGIKNTKQLEEALAQEAIAAKKAPKVKKVTVTTKRPKTKKSKLHHR